MFDLFDGNHIAGEFGVNSIEAAAIYAIRKYFKIIIRYENHGKRSNS